MLSGAGPENIWNQICDVPQDDCVRGHVRCLLLARVDGKSPAEYLTRPERSVVREAAIRLLHRPNPTLAEAWRTVAGLDGP